MNYDLNENSDLKSTIVFNKFICSNAECLLCPNLNYIGNTITT